MELMGHTLAAQRTTLHSMMDTAHRIAVVVPTVVKPILEKQCSHHTWSRLYFTLEVAIVQPTKVSVAHLALNPALPLLLLNHRPHPLLHNVAGN